MTTPGYTGHIYIGESIIVSDIAIGCMLAFLGVWIYMTSFWNVWRLYFVPWLVSDAVTPSSSFKRLTGTWNSTTHDTVGAQLVMPPFTQDKFVWLSAKTEGSFFLGL